MHLIAQARETVAPDRCGVRTTRRANFGKKIPLAGIARVRGVFSTGKLVGFVYKEGTSLAYLLLYVDDITLSFVAAPTSSHHGLPPLQVCHDRSRQPPPLPWPLHHQLLRRLVSISARVHHRPSTARMHGRVSLHVEPN